MNPDFMTLSLVSTTIEDALNSKNLVLPLISPLNDGGRKCL